jgi:hypothetical protein
VKLPRLPKELPPPARAQASVGAKTADDAPKAITEAAKMDPTRRIA